MKHLRSIFEKIVKEDPADALNLPYETDYSALSPDELMVLIDQAADEGNFKEVERLNAYLKKELSPEEAALLTMESFVQLNESVAEAKVILKRFADDAVRKATPEINRNVNELPTEEREAAHNAAVKEIEDSFYRHPDYLEIQELFKSSPKYIGPFVAFRFIQEAPMEELTQIASLMVQLRTNLSDLLKTPEEYARMKKKAGETPGYEHLGDELNRLLKFSRGRWIVKALPKVACSTPGHIAAGLGPVNLRELYAAAPKEKQDRLLELGAEINDLDKPNLIKAIRLELSGKPNIDAIIDDLAVKLNSANTDRGELYEKAMSAYPGVAVLYDGPNHMVFSFRSDANLPILCGKAKGWCIQPAWYNTGYAGRFWSYADGSLQLGILDFTVDPTHNFHTVGWTIYPNGNINTVCNQPNRCASGGTYQEMMKGWSASGEQHSYPQEVIDAISLVFDEEVKFKSATDAIYKKIYGFASDERDRAEAMKKTILGLVRNAEDLVKSTNARFGDIAAQENINKQVIASELKNLRDGAIIREVQVEYIDKAKTKGLVSPADAKIFEIVMEESPLFTEQLLKNIKERNNLFITKISTMLPQAKSLNQSAVQRWEQIIQTIKDANTYIDSMTLKIQSSNEKKQD
jgi:hypothetical protein